jgi:hypothetical protein
VIALNHSFLATVPRAPKQAVVVVAFLDRVRRRTGRTFRVHPELGSTDMGGGTFIVWANRHRRDTELGGLAELLLRTLSGPFVDGATFEGEVHPPIAVLPAWLEETLRVLLAAAASSEERAGDLIGLLSPSPNGGADAPVYACEGSSVHNWFDPEGFDRDLTKNSPSKTTLECLREAAQQMGDRLVVLPSAWRSAEAWVLDCHPEVLLQALLGLETYVAALDDGLPRESCAERYREGTGIEMTRESGDVERKPARKQQRTFLAGSHGKQFFDMHAKPGKATRVHIWIAPRESTEKPRTIFVGHCGRHLD